MHFEKDYKMPEPPQLIAEAEEWEPTVETIKRWKPDKEETKSKIYAKKDVFKKKEHQDGLVRGILGRLKDQA